jgi:Polyketide cyclase / dehydrase and lipid transport
MHPILIAVLVALAVIVALFLIAVAMQPSTFRVSRSAKISAPPATVFAQVNDFHNWDAWSPWAKIDPACKFSFDGPPAGVGAKFAWAGNKKVGEGRMTITESKPTELILINLEFLKPFKATNTTEFTFKPEGNQTYVTWTMTGKNNFFFKAFCMFMNMDKMVGGDFERGLANMKAVVETPASRAP